MTPPTATQSNPAIARGIFRELVPATATKPGYMIFELPGSSYQLHLIPTTEVDAIPGKRIRGVITCKGRRVDQMAPGGRFIEPLFGRPRRVQGIVIAINPDRNALVVNAAGAIAVDGLSLPIVVELTRPDQQARDFAIGTMVGCDVMDGATFAPVS